MHRLEERVSEKVTSNNAKLRTVLTLKNILQLIHWTFTYVVLKYL